jgi:hypothetical protein
MFYKMSAITVSKFKFSPDLITAIWPLNINRPTALRILQNVKLDSHRVKYMHKILPNRYLFTSVIEKTN